MIARLKPFLQKKTIQNLAIVSLEGGLSKALNFVLLIFVARIMEPEGFGVYSFITVSIFFLTVFLDFGVESTVISFSSRFPAQSKAIFGIYVIGKTAALLAIFICLHYAPRVISLLINAPLDRRYLDIIFIGTAIDSYLLVITTYWQSHERFFVRALVNTGTYLVRCASIAAALALGSRDVKLMITLFAVSGLPFVLALAGYGVSFLKAVFVAGVPWRLVQKMAHYQKWIFAAAVPTIIMTRLDFYIVTSLLSLKEAGIYNAAVSLTGALSILLMAGSKVCLPKISKYNDEKKMKQYVRRVHKLIFCVFPFVVLLIFFSRDIIVLLFGEKYTGAVFIFQILLFSYVLTCWNVLLSLVYYALGNTRLMAVGAYVQLAVFVGTIFPFVPRLGVVAVAGSKLISDITYLIIVLVFLPNTLKVLKSGEHNPGIDNGEIA